MTPKNDKKIEKKNRVKLFLAQNCLNQKIDKNREKKIDKIILGSEFSEAKNEPTFRLYQKIDKKSRKKNRKLIFGSELSEANNELTFRIHQKNDKKS